MLGLSGEPAMAETLGREGGGDRVSRFGEVRSASPLAGLLIGLLPLAFLVGAVALSPRM
jgi:hypothetical protein